ncbi:MAG TPA: M23 family metallopeptidase [Saprospiraceae bacterium]|nr:M23 family metallopeptidase [Saprospiraceae bacterium]
MGLQKYFKFSRKQASGEDSDKEKRKWRERIKDVYMLTIRNNESLEVVSEFNLTLLSLYILLSSIFVAVAILVGSLFIFTPVLRYIPGGDQTASKGEIRKLEQQVTVLEKELAANATYNDAMKRRILGEHEYANDNNDTLRHFTQAELNVQKNDAEKKIAEEVAKGQFLNNQPDKETNAQTVSLKQMQFTSPVIGETSAGFNINSQHYGIDIIAPKGTPIKSITNGVVIFSDWTMETGNTIVIKHSNDLLSVYKHNEKLLKKSGDIVKAGEAIAIIGNTGTLTSGPHLHFELWYRQKPLNPKEYIRFE